jgi:hypothetical protein
MAYFTMLEGGRRSRFKPQARRRAKVYASGFRLGPAMMGYFLASPGVSLGFARRKSPLREN